MKKKKELWIVNHYATPPAYGGLTRHYYLAKYLQKLGYNVKIFASSAIHNSSFNFIKDKSLYKETIIDGVTYVHVRTSQYQGNKIKRIKNMLEFYFRCKRVLKKYAKVNIPDYIYSSSPHPLSPLIANSFAKKHKVKSVVETRDLWPESLIAYGILKSRVNPVYLVMCYLQRKMYLGADRLVFTMNNAKEYLKTRSYYKKLKLPYTLKNGIDFEEYKNNYNNYTVNDKDLEDKDTFKIIYTGSIRYTYNITMLCELAEKFKNNKKIMFLIYGDGPDAIFVKKYIKEHKLKNLRFKGFIDSKYLPYILSKADLALLHGRDSDISVYGMSTNKAAYYLAAGLPVISSYTQSYDEYSEKGCGVVLKKYSVEEYIKEIKKFYNMSKKELNNYSNNSRKYSREFDYECIVKNLSDLLEEE